MFKHFRDFSKNFEGRCAQPDGKQFQNLIIFGVVVVGPMPIPFDLGGILWYHSCMLQPH